MNKIQFKTRKEVSAFLKEKNIDTTNWTEEKWQSINVSQAEIHIQALAEAMWDAMNESVPKELKEGEYHIPFGDRVDEKELDKLMPKIRPASLNWYIEQLNILKIKVATARCARLSYMTFDGEIDYKKDIQLHDRLLADKHMSPFEHCARAMSDEEYYTFVKGNTPFIKQLETNPNLVGYIGSDKIYGWCRNFKGFIPYRYLIENER